MAFKKTMFVFTAVLALFFLNGCKTTQVKRDRKALRTLIHKEAYQQGYQEGVKENVRGVMESFSGNDFPYFSWQPPLVQRVWVPPYILKGSYIPGHWEEVIIKPGQWRREQGYPISNPKEAKSDRYNETALNENGASLVDPDRTTRVRD